MTDDDLIAIDDHPAGAQPNPPLGPQPAIHPSAAIRACRFGPYTAVGARTQMVETEFGAYSYIGEDGDIAHATVGKFCSIARMVRINPGNHPTWRAAQHHFTYRAAAYGLGEDEAEFFAWRRAHAATLGHDVWIGHGAVIMAGVTVATGAVVGAGAVVTRDVTPYMIVAGVPARPIRSRVSSAIAERLQALAWWHWHHDQLSTALADFRALSAEAFLERYEG